MAKSIVVAMLGIAFGVATAGTARGQVEVGGGAGGAFPIDGNGVLAIRLLDARFTVPVNHRFAVEGAFDPLPGNRDFTEALYGVQVKQRILRKSSPATDAFVTYGGWGFFSHYPEHDYGFATADHVVHEHSIPARTELYPRGPLLPGIGVGLQRIAGLHSAVRFDLQTFVMLPYPSLVTRATVGVSVPLGRYSIHSTGRRDVIQ